MSSRSRLLRSSASWSGAKIEQAWLAHGDALQFGNVRLTPPAGRLGIRLRFTFCKNTGQSVAGRPCAALFEKTH